jgi:hypothetical protein
LYFEPGTKVSIQVNNPIFSNYGSYTLPLSIPLEQNRKTFGFPDRLGMASVRKRIDGYVFIGNNQIDCVILLLNVSTSIRISITFYDSIINYLNKSISLKELNIPNVNIGPIADTQDYLEDTLTKSYPERIFNCFPIAPNPNNPGTWTDYEINKWAHTDMSLPDPHIKYGFYNLLTIIPFLYVSYAIDKIMEQVGKHVTINQFKIDAELNSLVIVHLNRKSLILTPDGMEVDVNILMPNVTASVFFKRLWSTFGVKIVSSIFQSNAKIILVKNIFNQMPVEDLTNYVSSEKTIDYSAINTGLKFVPDFSVNDDYYKEQVQDISGKALLGSYATFGALPSVGWTNAGYVAYVVDEDKYYESKETGWELYSRNIQSYTSGDGSNTIDNQLPGLLMDTWEGYLPALEYYMGKSFLEVNNVDQSLLLAFYRGMHEEPTTGEDFPYGSGDIYKTAGGVTFPGANYALKNDGTNGLINKFWSKYITWFTSTMAVEMLLNLSLQKIMAMDLTQIYRINQINYFISEMRFDLNIESDKISAVKTTLKKAH